MPDVDPQQPPASAPGEWSEAHRADDDPGHHRSYTLFAVGLAVVVLAFAAISIAVVVLAAP